MDPVVSFPTADAASPCYRTSPPAKLNVFLEILARRDDGFHELDTVMIAIDWCDELRLQMTDRPGISLSVDWVPDRATIAGQMNVTLDDVLLDVPTDETNLVYRALAMINEATGYGGGWDARLGKRIPSGAGMGGASSDAAATLRLARAAIASVSPEQAAVLSDQKMAEMAARLGSDVPFFLGNVATLADAIRPPAGEKKGAGSLARALGRGERLTFYDLPQTQRFVVIYPAVSISTASVYARAVPSPNPQSGLNAVNAFLRPDPDAGDEILYNALAGPASGLSPRIGESLECLDRSGSRSQPRPHHRTHCQMTGSGSACFAWLISDPTPSDTDSLEPNIPTQVHAETAAAAEAANEAWVTTIRDSLSGGALVKTVASCPAAPEIHIV